ncbi:MAG: sterol desaturase family protein, partial [Verrucomicrobiaceae bacterium]|nr:sterol desaturase family protein [Verrucomicrobiaceae bacterium]
MKPDPSVGKVLIGLLILSAIFFVIERWLGKGRKQAVIRKGWLTDAVYWFFTPFVSKQFAVIGVLIPAGILVVAGVATKEGLLLREYTGFGPLTHQPLWLQAIEVYVLGDFVSYWTH